MSSLEGVITLHNGFQLLPFNSQVQILFYILRFTVLAIRTRLIFHAFTARSMDSPDIHGQQSESKLQVTRPTFFGWSGPFVWNSLSWNTKGSWRYSIWLSRHTSATLFPAKEAPSRLYYFCANFTFENSLHLCFFLCKYSSILYIVSLHGKSFCFVILYVFSKVLL